jgi:ATP-dependent DNA ligase
MVPPCTAGASRSAAPSARETQTKHVNAAAFRSKQEDATTWLVPKLVSEVKFTEWTSEGEMRHPVFLGLHRQKANDGIREQT